MNQLEYVLKRIAIIENDLDSYLKMSGRKKSYGIKCQQARNSLTFLREEIALWQEYGLFPEVLVNEQPNCKRQE